MYEDNVCTMGVPKEVEDIDLNPRKKEARKEILKREWTKLMTDDERAKFYGLSEGCRMREGVKDVFNKLILSIKNKKTLTLKELGESYN